MANASNFFDVIVIGGGHAGCESAIAAHNLGARTALVTFSSQNVGVLSCNPAFGGVGKGHIVCEIDALNGGMGMVADKASLQYRLLNRSRGPAVRGPRAQVDRAIYAREMQKLIHQSGNIEVIAGEVEDLLIEYDTDAGKEQCKGVVLKGGVRLTAHAVVLTTGTFLGGLIFRGDIRTEAGRVGEKSATRLKDNLLQRGMATIRLKTGTPPRLRADSIDFAKFQKQPGDVEPTFFSPLTEGRNELAARQLHCHIAHTNGETKQIVEDNLERSALYGGEIEGVGPRYCPSIEDKIRRFHTKEVHQVFLEPEGFDSNLIYPNGLSTSLPSDVQKAFINSMAGLEKAEIDTPGYAVEYSAFDPRQLHPTLESKQVQRLLLAGQINGTTGYEEAGGQGVIAGINAAKLARNEELFVPDASESYIGVMIRDLTTKGVDEPYRMFTSRAEHRLKLRIDNVAERMVPQAFALGLIHSQDKRWLWFAQHEKQVQAAVVMLNHKPGKKTPSNPQPGEASREVEKDTTLGEFAKRCRFDRDEIIARFPYTAEWTGDVFQRVMSEALYDGYEKRYTQQLEKAQAAEGLKLKDFADTLGETQFATISHEAKEKLLKYKPKTVRDAMEIPGLTPHVIATLVAHAVERTQ